MSTTHSDKCLDRCRQQATDRIRAAFAHVTRGNGITLSQARAIDDYGSDEQEAQARARDPEMRWEDVPDEKIASLNDVLSFLDMEGFRFYIPAYMCWTLRHFDDSASASSTATIHSFDWPYRDCWFTDEERRAIAQFLLFIVEHGDEWDAAAASKAINERWYHYLS